ncbi:hypothetical protein Btru_007441 [Bulinus truncatus]|nr:hypothetical protein Btru_007441 [Bulinus truncatus]
MLVHSTNETWTTDMKTNRYLMYYRLCLLCGSLFLLVLGITGRQPTDHRCPVPPLAEGPQLTFLFKQLVFTLWLDLTLVAITTWHVTLITLCRLVYIMCRPRKFSSSKCHMCSVVFICLVCCSLNATLIHDGLVVLPKQNSYTSCGFNTRTWHYWVESAFSSLLPITLLLLCDFFLLCLNMSLKKKTANFLGVQGARKRIEILVVMSTLLLVLTTVPIKVLEGIKEHVFESRSEAKFYLTAANMLLFVNNAVNYFLYCFMEKRLRSQTRLIFYPLCDFCCLYEDRRSSPTFDLKGRYDHRSRMVSSVTFNSPDSVIANLQEEVTIH